MLGGAIAAALTGRAVGQASVSQGGGGGGGGTLDFFSDWSTATGTSTSARGDGGKHDTIAGTGQTSGSEWHEVVSATGLGFPAAMNNVHRSMVYEETPSVGVSGTVGYNGTPQFTIPAVNEYQFMRVYFRLNAANGDNVGILHGMHFGGGAGVGDMWLAFGGPVSAGATNMHLIVDPNQGGEFYHTPGTIDIDETYRLEVRLQRTATLTVEVSARVYDSSGTLVYDDTDFGFSSTQFSFPDADDFFANWQFGANDSVVAGDMAAPGYLYFGGFAIRVSSSSTDWIGAFGVGDET